MLALRVITPNTPGPLSLRSEHACYTLVFPSVPLTLPCGDLSTPATACISEFWPFVLESASQRSLQLIKSSSSLTAKAAGRRRRAVRPCHVSFGLCCSRLVSAHLSALALPQLAITHQCRLRHRVRQLDVSSCPKSQSSAGLILRPSSAIIGTAAQLWQTSHTSPSRRHGPFHRFPARGALSFRAQSFTSKRSKALARTPERRRRISLAVPQSTQTMVCAQPARIRGLVLAVLQTTANRSRPHERSR